VPPIWYKNRGVSPPTGGTDPQKKLFNSIWQDDLRLYIADGNKIGHNSTSIEL